MRRTCGNYCSFRWSMTAQMWISSPFVLPPAHPLAVSLSLPLYANIFGLQIAIRVSHTFGSCGCCSRLRFSNWFSPMLLVYHCARFNKAASVVVAAAAVAATTHLTQSHIPVLAVRCMRVAAAAAASNKKSTQSNSITLIHFLSSSHTTRASIHTRSTPVNAWQL